MKTIRKSPIMFAILSLIAFFAFAKQEKVIQIFRNGEIIQEYSVDDIDYIEVNDLIRAPDDVNASVTNDQITIKWNAVEGATYNVYRSPDNTNFTLLASGLNETTYTDTKPLRGSNFYRVKAVVGDVESGYTSSAAATLTSSELDNGIYLGITGFNQALYEYPVLQLSESSVDGFRNFIDGLTMKNGTVLYYSVDQALNTMQATELPSDITTAAMVTFTDGLDQGSFMMDGVSYDDEMDYLDALNRRIKNETVSGQPITSFSIGIRGKDVADIDMFRTNLAKLAYDPKNPDRDENAFEVSNMSEVNAKFKEIAEKLSESNYVQTINLKMPGLSNGTRVRFTFDNVNDANKSEIFIEGKFNLKDKSLEEVQYVGLTSTSGTTVKGTVDGIFVNFTFDGVQTDNNVLIKSEFTDEWTYIASNSTWQINSEFDKTENSDIVTKRSSAVIMLVLDCSSSLADDFVKAQTNAKDFISTLYQAVGGTENPGEQEETIYSTTPKDLTLSVWKGGKRYFLNKEQYENANLNGAIIEGLCVINGAEDPFIISLRNDNIDAIRCEMAKILYDLPTYSQGVIISSRWTDINNAIKSFGGTALYELWTSGYYSSNYPYAFVAGSGGSLNGGNSKYETYVRNVVSIKSIQDRPMISDNNDLNLVVTNGEERIFLKRTSDYSNKIPDGYSIEGVAVCSKLGNFIIALFNASSDAIYYHSAVTSYGENNLPTKDEGLVISSRWTEINNAIKYFGGTALYELWTSGYYSSNYPYAFVAGSGGSLNGGNSKYETYVRLIISRF